MKAVLKHFIIDTVSLYIISQLVSGMIFSQGIYTLLLAGVALMVTNMVVKPIINVLLLPLNLVTFGLFKWVTSAIAFYLVTLIVPGFKIVEFAFHGYQSYWFSIPGITLPGIFAFLGFAFIVSLVSSVVYWIFK